MNILSCALSALIVTTHFFVILPLQEVTSYSSQLLNLGSNSSCDTVKTIIVPVNCQKYTRNIKKRNECHGYDRGSLFIHYSAAQFKNYFAYFNYSEKEIFFQHTLYVFDEFIHLIKTLPGYEQYITLLHRKIQKMTVFQKLIGSLKGTHWLGFTQRINHLYKKLVNVRKNSDFIAQKSQALPVVRMNTVPRCHQQIIDILNSCNEQRIVAIKIDAIKQSIYSDLVMQNISIHPAVELYLGESIDIIRTTQNYGVFVFHLLVVDRVLSDVQAKVQATVEGKPTILERSPELVVRAVTKFVGALNPVTQAEGIYDLAKDVLSAAANIVMHPFQTAESIRYFSEKSYEFIANTACFASDLTVGKLYLKPDEYQQRKNSYLDGIKALPFELLQQLTAEQVVDITAQIAADFVFCRGLGSAYIYLKEIDTMSSVALAKEKLSKMRNKTINIMRRLKNAIDVHLTENPLLVTAEGIVIKMDNTMKNVSGGAGKEIITDVKALLESAYAKVAIDLEKVIQKIKTIHEGKLFGFGELAFKTIKIDLQHILGIAIDWIDSGMAVKLSGFHHDLNNALGKSGAVKIIKNFVDMHGCYLADVVIGEIEFRGKTFFPAHWSREEVISKIYEACDNFGKSGSLPEFRKGKYHIVGFTNEGIAIKMHITQKGEILSAYPKLLG